MIKMSAERTAWYKDSRDVPECSLLSLHSVLLLPVTWCHSQTAALELLSAGNRKLAQHSPQTFRPQAPSVARLGAKSSFNLPGGLKEMGFPNLTESRTHQDLGKGWSPFYWKKVAQALAFRRKEGWSYVSSSYYCVKVELVCE